MFVVFLAVAVLLAPAAVLAQTTPTSQTQDVLRQMVEQKLGRSLSNAELIQRLQQSGMTRSQVRARLQQMGYDPGLADQYFDALEKGGQPTPGDAPPNVVSALNQVGLSLRGADTLSVPLDSLGMPLDTLPEPTDSAAPGELPIFGRDLFRRGTSQFQPVSAGPVDPDYRLGPGDQLVLVLTGDVENAYKLSVTREGYIVIPDVGQVWVNGLTLRELEDRLYQRLGDVYSGIQRGPGATAHFQVSVGQLRNSQVFVIGEVERPGAYQVSSVATAFNALYAARGPNKNGSFRRIQVRRGGEVVRTIDVYDYLLHGDSRADIRLEQGDVIFVPVVGPQVGIKGAVRRPALYEMLPDEGLRDLLQYAGRAEAGAVMNRVQIDRILPPDRRRPGVDRVLVDVDVRDLANSNGAKIDLADGDLVQVFSVSDERRNRLTLTGAVNRPGVYEWSPGTSLWQVIARADGLGEGAYTARAHIFRLNPEDGTRRLIQTPLLSDASGRHLQDVTLADRDSIVVYSQIEMANPPVVNIDGFVKDPGTFSLAEGMTVRDLILAAGGFTLGADTRQADVARRPDPLTRTDTTAFTFQVDLTSLPDRSARTGQLAATEVNLQPGMPTSGEERATTPAWLPRGDELVLQPGDHVFIRKAAGYEVDRIVHVTGQVIRPGAYVLSTREERLLDILRRAGGLTAEANAAGIRVKRDGQLVGTDVPRAMQNPDSRYNIVVQSEDSIEVPMRDPTVLVRGAVAFESRVLYSPGKDLDYYIAQSGGYTDEADKDRASVTYQNGERAVVHKILFHRGTPPVEPGSTIFVPGKPEESGGFNWDQFLSRTLSIVSTTVTLLVAAKNL